MFYSTRLKDFFNMGNRNFNAVSENFMTNKSGYFAIISSTIFEKQKLSRNGSQAKTLS